MEERKEIIKIHDKKVIKSIIFKYPELMKDNSEELIRKEYSDIIALEEELFKQREKVRELETLLDNKKTEFNTKSILFDLEFDSSEKEITLYKANVMIQGYGNDILGKSANM